MTIVFWEKDNYVSSFQLHICKNKKELARKLHEIELLNKQYDYIIL